MLSPRKRYTRTNDEIKDQEKQNSL